MNAKDPHEAHHGWLDAQAEDKEAQQLAQEQPKHVNPTTPTTED